MSHPGSFPCRAILHVDGEKDAGIIKGLMGTVISHCENFRFQSVALPAICAGK